MSRLGPIRPEQMNADQQELYDALTGGPRAHGPAAFALTREDGSLVGPFNAMLLSPSLGRAVQEVGASIRYAGGLPSRARELAILVVAAHWDSAFEREAHELVGAAVGLTDDEMAAVRDHRVPDLGDVRELACVLLARALVSGDVDDDTWAASVDALGKSLVFELSTLVGYYAMLALQMRVFRVT